MSGKKEAAIQAAVGKIERIVERSVKIDFDEDLEMKNEIKLADNQDEDEIAMVDTQPTSPPKDVAIATAEKEANVNGHENNEPNDQGELKQESA